MSDTHFIDKEPDKYEALKKLQSQQISSMNEDEINDILSKLESKLWCLNTSDFIESRTLGYSQYLSSDIYDQRGNPDPNKIELVPLKGIHDRHISFLSNLKYRAIALNIHSKEGETDIGTIEERINTIIKQAEDGFDNIRRHKMSWERVANPTLIPQQGSFSDPSTMSDEDRENATPFQKCLIYTLDEAYKSGYRRYKSQCCEEITTIEGFKTRAWEPKFSIEHFVYSLARKDTRYNVWKNFTSRGSIYRDVIDNISKCMDEQFPEIVKRRHVWSFKNGVFVGKEWIPDKGVYECRFYPYESDKFKCLDPTIIACKYFDQRFDDFSHLENWQDIPTPYFDSILQYQNFEKDVCDWAYVMGGRLCYDVGELDAWQVIPFFKGIARSGKSTLITKVFKKFYENEDVGTLSNNIEKKFGLSAIKDAFMFIAPEVKGDLALEQAEFQSMVSGEDVSVAVKNKTAVSIEWKVPGVLGGNEVPNWKDNSGSVLRRILPWNFSKQVKDADPQLDEKLNGEIPIILLKCVRAYLDFSNKYRNKDIWNVVPEYFKTVQKQVAMVASSLHNFMESTLIEYGKEMFVPQKLFVQIFNQHCQANNLGRHKFTPDFYAGPFSSREIEVREETVTYKGRTYPKQPVIYGLDVVDESLGFTDDY
jgi:hypothetical protein